MSTIYASIINPLSENGLLDIECIRGCTDHQLEKIKERQKISNLPAYYVDFMKIMGVSGADKIHWSLTYANQLTNKEVLIEDVHTGEIEGWHPGPLVELPDDICVFYCGENIVYHFFRTTDKSEDPVIFTFKEEREHFEETEMTLSEWLRLRVEEKIRLKNISNI